jgi:hypothetical protein
MFQRFLLLILAFCSAAAIAEPVDRCDQVVGYQLQNSFSGNTVASFGNQYDVGTCAGTPKAPWLPASGAAFEQVIKLRVAASCTLTVSMTGSASGANFNDPAPYLATSCPIADPGITQILDASCLAAADQTGQLGTENFSVSLLPATDYFLYLDGFLDAQGPYNVNLTGCALVDGATSPLVFADGFEEA